MKMFILPPDNDWVAEYKHNAVRQMLSYMSAVDQSKTFILYIDNFG